MTRTLTPAHRRKLAAGRARALRALHTTEDRQLRVWRQWLRREAQSYAELVTARNTYGDESPEAVTALKAWQRTRKAEPTRPPDSAFKRSRGEESEDDSN